MLASTMKWSVLWIAKKQTKKGTKKYIYEKEFGDDLSGAMELFEKAKRAKKPLATLLSKNTAFGPPERLRPYDEVRVIKVRKSGKLVKRRKTFHVVPMEKYNEQRWFWCPYCMALRRFPKLSGFRERSSGIWVPTPVIACQMCGIHHTNHWVRYWNPELHRTPMDLTQRRFKRKKD